MTELDIYRGGTLSDRMQYTNALAAAQGLLPSSIASGNPQAIAARTFFVTETGDMLGIHPLAAIQGVNVIEGKPSLAPALMSALVRRAGHKLRVHRSGDLAAGTYRVRVEVVRAYDPDHTFVAEWTMDRAVRAGLAKYERGTDGVWRVEARSRNGHPQPWEKYTEAMLYARALSECCREAAEDVLFGVHYTPEELGAVVDGEGNVIDAGDAQVAPSAPEPTAMPAERKRATNGAQGVRAPASAPAPSAPAPEASVPAPAENVAEAAAEPAPEADPSEAAPVATVPPGTIDRQPIDEPVDAEVVPDEPEPTEPEDQGPAAVLDDAPAGPSEYEIARAEEPDNWTRQALAASTEDDLKTVWFGAEAAGALDVDLKRTITLRVNAARAKGQ